MSSCLAFNKIKIGDQWIHEADFVNGSGTLLIRGLDKEVHTADGSVHYFRLSLMKTLSFQCRGDQRILASPLGRPWPISVFLGETALASFEGLVTVSWENDPSVSTVKASGAPEFQMNSSL